MKMLIYLACLLFSFGLPTLLGAPYKYYTAEWYKKLKRPSFAFPDIVFIVIFPVFYILESVGLFIILVNDNSVSLYTYGFIFFASAILSGIWSRLFFIYKRCDYSLIAFFIEIPFSVVLVYMLYTESHMAWIFFVPRMVWAFYAIFANIQFYRLNKSFWDDQKII